MNKITNRDLDRMVDNAQQAFWESVTTDAKKFGIKSGDFPPGATMKFDDACYKAVEIWVDTNQLDESTRRISDDSKLKLSYGADGLLDLVPESLKSFEEFVLESNTTSEVAFRIGRVLGSQPRPVTYRPDDFVIKLKPDKKLSIEENVINWVNSIKHIIKLSPLKKDAGVAWIHYGNGVTLNWVNEGRNTYLQISPKKD